MNEHFGGNTMIKVLYTYRKHGLGICVMIEAYTYLKSTT